MVDTDDSTPAYHTLLFSSPSMPGVVLGTVMLWFSLGSSLLPRAATMQGAVSALSFVFGYAVGVLAWFVVRMVGRLFGKSISCDIAPNWLQWTFRGMTVAVLAVAVIRWPAWQSEQRLLVGLEEIGITDGLMAVVWTLLGVAVLMLLGRSIRWLIWKLDRFNARHAPEAVARGITALILVGIFGALYWFVASSGLAAFANDRFGPADETTLEGITQPAATEYSGSPESLVQWDDLGLQGRTFTGAGTAVVDITAFYDDAGPQAKVPIRVYAGLKSAESSEERAQLVVDELVRTNAEERAVIALVAATGTGWVDPIAAAALEYMYAGDTAIAAMQYSFLPSWISFVLDTATSTEAGIAINEAVIEWWETLPENDRPRLVAFGESLGTLGSEAAYAQDGLDESLAYIQSKIDGALWVGPTDANLIRRQFLAERDASPVWSPTYDGGAIVRMANGTGQIDPNDASWAEPRVLYYHHPSDPVGYWNWETLWAPQEWSDDPVGYDVPASVRWIPFTTFTQVVVDLINGFSASVGNGHNYNDVFVEGWSIVAPREGWTASDTTRLEDYLRPLDLPGL